MNKTTLKPGLLVSLKSTIAGNVSYRRVDLDHEREAQTDITRWETTRIVSDKAEHDRAVEVRAKARNMISGVCIHTSFGLLCPEDREAELESAMQNAAALVAEFNAGACQTVIGLYPFCGLVERDNERAARAIAAEVRELLDAMAANIDKLDVKGIRDAADRAKQIGAMLDSQQQERVDGAVKAARSAARKIVKAVKEAGDNAKLVLGEMNKTAITTARFAFLDTDETGQTAEPSEALPAVAVQRFGDLFDSSEPEPDTAPEPAETQLQTIDAT